MDILITGSIAYDYLMRFPGRFKEALVSDSLDKISVSFLVHDMTRHQGGVAANIAYSVALLGGRPRLMGTVGQDFGDYRRNLEAVGVDTSTTIELAHLFTASFFANTDLDNNQIASFYAGAMGDAGKFNITDVTDHRPDLVVISPNAPDAMTNIARECRERGIPYLYDPSQQTPRTDGDTLRECIDGCTILTVNEYEWELVQQKTGLTRDDVLKHGATLIVTKGRHGADIFTGDTYVHTPAIDSVSVADPTGGGDAFRGGILRGLQLGGSWELNGQIGSLLAAYAIEVVGTQNHRFDRPSFVQRFRQHFDDMGFLDSLLDEHHR